MWIIILLLTLLLAISYGIYSARTRIKIQDRNMYWDLRIRDAEKSLWRQIGYGVHLRGIHWKRSRISVPSDIRLKFNILENC